MYQILTSTGDGPGPDGQVDSYGQTSEDFRQWAPQVPANAPPAEAQASRAPSAAPGVWSQYAARHPELCEQSGQPQPGHVATSTSNRALDPFATVAAGQPDPIDIDGPAAPATRAPAAIRRPPTAAPAAARPRAPKQRPAARATGPPAAAPPRVPRQRPSTRAVGGDHETIDVDQMDPEVEHQAPPPPPNTRPPSPPPAIRTLSPPPPTSAPPPRPPLYGGQHGTARHPQPPPPPYSRDDPARRVRLSPRRRYSTLPSRRYRRPPRPQGRSRSSPPPRRRSPPGARQPPRRGRRDEVAPTLQQYRLAHSYGQPPHGPLQRIGTALVSAILLVMLSTRASTIALAKVSTRVMRCIVSFVMLFVVTGVSQRFRPQGQWDVSPALASTVSWDPRGHHQRDGFPTSPTPAFTFPPQPVHDEAYCAPGTEPKHHPYTTSAPYTRVLLTRPAGLAVTLNNHRAMSLLWTTCSLVHLGHAGCETLNGLLACAHPSGCCALYTAGRPTPPRQRINPLRMNLFKAHQV